MGCARSNHNVTNGGVMLFPNVRRLKEDLSGVSKDNYIPHDVREIPSTAINRVIRLRYGKFFGYSLKLIDKTGRELVPWVDYKLGEMDKLTAICGKAVHQDIIITNMALSGNVIARYNAVGGEIGLVAEDRIDIYESIVNDKKTYYWKDILGKPDAFVPSAHTHPVWTITNYAPAAESLRRFFQALKNADKYPNMKTIVQAVDKTVDDTVAKLKQLQRDITNHDANRNNPHKNSHGQTIGIENVDNFPMATLAIAKEGKSMVHFLSPQVAQQSAMDMLMANDSGVVHTARAPMTQFGDLTDNKIKFSTSGWVLNINEDVPGMFGGIEHVLTKASLDVRKFVDAPANKTLLLYIRITSTGASYEVAPEASPEKITYINVGEIKTNGSGITSATIDKVTALGTFRVSPTKIGSAIATTQGLPNTQGSFNWIN